MGDNANASWAWHNNVVGTGYQASGVVRQPGVAGCRVEIVDMRGPSKEIGIREKEVTKRQKKKKSKKEGKDKKDKKDKKDTKDKKDKKKKSKKRSRNNSDEDSCQKRFQKEDIEETGFNPILQLLASRIGSSSKSF